MSAGDLTGLATKDESWHLQPIGAKDSEGREIRRCSRGEEDTQHGHTSSRLASTNRRRYRCCRTSCASCLSSTWGFILCFLIHLHCFLHYWTAGKCLYLPLKSNEIALQLINGINVKLTKFLFKKNKTGGDVLKYVCPSETSSWEGQRGCSGGRLRFCCTSKPKSESKAFVRRRPHSERIQPWWRDKGNSSSFLSIKIGLVNNRTS